MKAGCRPRLFRVRYLGHACALLLKMTRVRQEQYSDLLCTPADVRRSGVGPSGFIDKRAAFTRLKVMETIGGSPAELVQRIAAGDRSASDELIGRYSRGVQFILNGLVSERALAEDLYQDTFCLVLEKIKAGEVQEPERLSGFICSVARNLAIGHFRKSSRRGESSQLDSSTTPIPSPSASQLDQLLRDEKGRLARRVLDMMPSERDRTVLFRFYVAEDEKEDICADLGLSSLHFNQILCRARERYKKLFEEMRHSP
jgi:RNA polymerase sigma-70 factor (ECF subfamily)